MFALANTIGLEKIYNSIYLASFFCKSIILTLADVSDACD